MHSFGDVLQFRDIAVDRWLSCFLAVDAAKSCIHVWSENHPKDEKPNKAIEAAEAWLSNPCKETADASSYAAAATAAAYAYAAAYDSSYAAAAAAYDSSYAATAANAANAYAADYAAYYASKVLNQDKEEYISSLLHKHLSFIIDYKIEHNQSFGDFEAVFEAASEEDKERLLFCIGQ